MEFMLSLLCFFKNYKNFSRAPFFFTLRKTVEFIMLSLLCFFFADQTTTFSIKFFSYLSSYKSSLKLNFLFTLLLLRIRIHDDGGVRLRFFVCKAALSSLFLICKIVVVATRSLF